MLSKTSSADVTTAISSAEFLQPEREFSPGFPFDIGSFPSPDEEKEPKDQNGSSEEKEAQKVSSHPIPEMFDLAFGKDFQEMIDLFMVPDQEKIVAVRKNLYQQQTNRAEIGSRRLFTQEIDQVRSRLYRVQVQLFSSPVGGQCYLSA